MNSYQAKERAALRQRVFKGGTIEFGGGAIDCVVRNQSTSGALLGIESPIGIPSEFNLIIAKDGIGHLCFVVWRMEKLIGVRFQST
jgi:hypothetical protein